jgi:hypothetical protein
MVLAFLALVGLQTSAQAPITLARQFTKNEKLGYQFLSHITAEHRVKNLDTWLPEDLDINYNFTTQVTQLKADGIAVVHYLRPTLTEIEGETFDSGPKTKVDNIDLNYLLTLSPINEILEDKSLSKPKPETPSSDDGRWINANVKLQSAMDFFAPYISDIHRLALFIGGVQDSLDFSPKFPLNPVKPGDTWKYTVGFQPQKLKGADGKSAVQRLDYTYTLVGPMTSQGKQVIRVDANLDFSTDLSEFLKQLLKDHASETNVSKVPLHFKSVIHFDLDPKTKETLRAEGSTEGGYQVYLLETGTDAAIEERFKGRMTMAEVGKRIVAGSP